jgi:hypothetical protein
MTYPLVINLSESIPFNYRFHGQYNLTSRDFLENFDTDALHSYSIMWSFANNGFDISKLTVHSLGFSIGDYRRELGLRWFPFSLFFLFARIFDGYVVAYNVIMLLSFPLSAAGMYLLSLQISKNEKISILAGILYAIAPFRVAQLSVGHMEGVVCALLPFIFYFIERAYSEMNKKYSLAAGFIILLVTFSEWHFTYYLIMFIPILLFFKFIEYLSKAGISNSNLKKPLLTATPVLLLIGISVIWVLATKDAAMGEEAGRRDVYEIRLYTPSIDDFFKKINPNNERAVYLGYAAMALLIVGISSAFLKRSFYVYGIILVVSLLIALGLDFPFRQTSLYKLLYDYLPFFNHFRLPGRIVALSLMPISFFCGYGIVTASDYFGSLNKKAEYVGILVLMGILVVDFNLAPIGIVKLDAANSAYTTLASIPENSKLLSIPLTGGSDFYNSVYMYYATIHGKRVINGYAPWSPPVYSELLGKLESLYWGDIGVNEYKVLRELDVGYLAYHRRMFGTPYASQRPEVVDVNLFSSRYLEFLKEDEEIYIFRVLPEPALKNDSSYFSNKCSFTEPLYANGWFGLERWSDGVEARWSKKYAVVYLCSTGMNISKRQLLIINYTKGYVPISFNVSINDVLVKNEIADEDAWKMILIDTNNLNMSGLVKITLELNDTFSPKDFGSTDSRDLGIAVSSIKFGEIGANCTTECER